MHPAASAAPSDKRWPSERFHCIQGCREKAAGHVGETAVRRRRKDASAAAQRTGRCRVESKRDRSLRHKLPSPGTGAASVANRSPRGEELRWHWQGWWKIRKKERSCPINFLSLFITPHPGTRKPTIFGDFRFPNYPLFDNFHCRLLLRCPVLSSHHRLSMSLPLQHHTQMLRRYHWCELGPRLSSLTLLCFHY